MAYGQSALEKPISIHTLKAMKESGEKFVTVALYDAPMAAMAESCGVEVLLVGDSLGMTVLGFESTIPVTMEQMIYHIEAVSRGSQNALVMGDLPFMTYSNVSEAMRNATRVMQAGAHMVKIEGGEWLCETVSQLSDRGIPVCAHIGLTPQSVNKLGGYRVQGRDEQSARRLIHEAKMLERAGASAVVLECIPSSLGAEISQALSIPTIGIGAGIQTDAQVLVVNDILGLTPNPPKFSKNFLKEADDIPAAMKKYAEDVKSGIFPGPENCFN
jgi:3-methyl-2-oxobutanoate hydroxymethyltransferase